MNIDLALCKIGAVVATLVPAPSKASDLALYAQASGDTNPLHLDPAVALAAGFERPLVHGMLGMAHFGRLLTDHFAVESIRTLNARFCAVVLSGETVRYEAILEEDGRDYYRLALRAVTAAGVVAITGTALIAALPPVSIAATTRT